MRDDPPFRSYLMRSPKDRIRQAVAFELIGLLLFVPLSTLVFPFPLAEMGMLGIFGATLATVWNYLFNLGFDHALKRLTGSTRKSLGQRIIHALAFELGLMLVFLPVVAWWLDIGVLEALVMDLAFVVFYIFYTFLFTWCYDTLFPDTDAASPASPHEQQESVAAEPD